MCITLHDAELMDLPHCVDQNPGQRIQCPKCINVSGYDKHMGTRINDY